MARPKLSASTTAGTEAGDLRHFAENRLRAVKDDAVGYAHSSDVSLPALIRAADAVAAVRGGQRQFSAAPAHTNVRLYADENPLDAPGFEAKVKLLGEIDAYVRDKDPQGAAGFRRPRGRLAGGRNPHPTAKAIAPAGAGQYFRGRRAGRPAGKRRRGNGGREGLRGASKPSVARGRRRRDPREALVNLKSVPAPAGEMDVVLGAGWPGVMLRGAPGHGLEGNLRN